MGVVNNLKRIIELTKRLDGLSEGRALTKDIEIVLSGGHGGELYLNANVPCSKFIVIIDDEGQPEDFLAYDGNTSIITLTADYSDRAESLIGKKVIGYILPAFALSDYYNPLEGTIPSNIVTITG